MLISTSLWSSLWSLAQLYKGYIPNCIDPRAICWYFLHSLRKLFPTSIFSGSQKRKKKCNYCDLLPGKWLGTSQHLVKLIKSQDHSVISSHFQDLIRTTSFSRQEIQCMYRGFKQVCGIIQIFVIASWICLSLQFSKN